MANGTYTRIILVVLFLFIFIFNGYSQTADLTQGCAPVSVQFAAPNGQSGYFWDFDDRGTSSDLQNPAHNFINPGTHVVRLLDAEGGNEIGIITIEVFSKPDLDFVGDPFVGCAPLTVNFTDNTIYTSPIIVQSRVWTFGDGGSSTSASASNTYNDQGMYSIGYTITTNFSSCDTTAIKSNYIEVGERLEVDFSIDPGGFSCSAPYTVNFANLSPSGAGITYLWDFGNGNTSEDFSPTNITYTQDGEFDVKLTVTSADAGCSNSETKKISISKPSLRNSVRDTHCYGVPNLLFAFTGNAVYEWDFGPDASPSTSTSQTNNITFNRTGFHTVYFKISDIDGNCFADTTMSVYVQKVDVSFTMDPEHICEFPGDITYNANYPNGRNYSWTFNNGNFKLGKEVVNEVELPDTDYYHQLGPFYVDGTLFVTSSAGCRSDTIWTDTFIAPYAVLLVNDDDGCAPLSVTFDYFTQSKEPITSYILHFGDGQTQAFTNPVPITYVYPNTGEYDAYLVIVNSAGCRDTSVSVLIEVGSLLDADFTTDITELCLGEIAQLTVSNFDPLAEAYYFNVDGYNERPLCHQFPTTAFRFDRTTGPQDVSLTIEYNGCFSTITKEDFINVNGSVADFTYTIDCDNPKVVNFTNLSDVADSYVWNLGNDPEYQNPTFSYEYANTGDFFVTLEAVNSDCPNDFIIKEVFIKEPQAEMRIFDSFGDVVTEPYRLCGEADYFLDASPSVDVVQACGKGYTWHFNEGSELTPIKTSYANALIEVPKTGIHDITLEVVDVNGCTNQTVINYQSYSRDADFTISDTTICLPAEVQFTSSSVADTTIVDYIFITEDGAILNDPVSIYNYTSALPDSSVTNVRHVITDALGCRDTLDKIINIYVPNSTISADPFRSVCVNRTIELSATDFTSQGSFLTYDWLILDSVGTTSVERSFDIEFPFAGSYGIILTITEDATGCQNIVTETISVQAFPIAGFSSNQDTTQVLCNPTTIVFTDTTVTDNSVTYKWYIDGVVESVIQNPAFSLEKGIYEIFMNAKTTFGCGDTSDFRIFEVIGPEGDIILDSATICKGESIQLEFTDTSDVASFEWDFGDGVIVKNENPVIHQYEFFPQSGRTAASLILFGPSGICATTKSIPIYIHEVIADFRRNDGIDTASCLGDYSFYSTSTNADNLVWDFGDGSIGQGDSLVYSYQFDGTYSVSLSVSNDSLSCVDTISKEIVLFPLPRPIGIGDTICFGDTARLMIDSASIFSFYDWAIDSTTIGVSGMDLIAMPLSSRNYQLIEEDSLGCIDSVGVFVNVIEPMQSLDWDTSIVIGDTAFLPIPYNPLFIYTWTPMEGLSCYACRNPSIQIFEDEFYSLLISDLLNCFETRNTYNITIIEEEKIRVPNLFSPNGDNANDVVFTEGWAIKELVYFRIYNRWGEKVFESNNMSEGWDGYHKGKPQGPGVYTYQVEAISWKNDNVLTQEGHIELIR